MGPYTHICSARAITPPIHVAAASYTRVRRLSTNAARACAYKRIRVLHAHRHSLVASSQQVRERR